MTPTETLNIMNSYLDNLRYAKKHSAYVGLPKDKVGGEVYGDGNTVIKIGAIHEYGKRSFLREPLNTKKKDILGTIDNQWKAIFEKGKDAKDALEIIGVKATNISKGAFTTLGYGKWEPITDATLAWRKWRSKNSGIKYSTQTMIDTGLLRSSITWSVRRDS